MENLIHDAWVLFVAMGSWMANQLTQKIDNVDKKLDQLRVTSIAVRAVEVKLKKGWLK